VGVGGEGVVTGVGAGGVGAGVGGLCVGMGTGDPPPCLQKGAGQRPLSPLVLQYSSKEVSLHHALTAQSVSCTQEILRFSAMRAAPVATTSPINETKPTSPV
jgi:hypothetical protein